MEVGGEVQALVRGEVHVLAPSRPAGVRARIDVAVVFQVDVDRWSTHIVNGEVKWRLGRDRENGVVR